MHSHDTARTNVMPFMKDCIWEYKMVESARFQPIYDTDTRDELAKLYAEYTDSEIFNGAVVMLESISDEAERTRYVNLAMGNFYDFICCNVIGREVASADDKVIRYFKSAGASPAALKAAEDLGKMFAAERERMKEFSDCLEPGPLPNVIAVSILVSDGEGSYLLSRRTDNVLIGKRLYGVTSTGTVEPADIMPIGNSRRDSKMMPFAACAQRELSEETPIVLPAESFYVRGFAIGHAKLQPIAIVDAIHEYAFDENFRLDEPIGSDNVQELKKVVAVPKERLAAMPEKYDMTEAAAFHIALQAEQ